MKSRAMSIVKGIIYSAIISAVIFSAAEAAGQGPGVSASADRRSIRIGDRLRYVIDVRTDAGTEVEFPDFKDGKIGDFEIRSSGTKVKKGVFGVRVVSGWYEITCFSVGRRTIPQAEIRYRAKGAKEWTAKKVRTIDIAVDSILAAAGGASDIKDIKGPISFFDVTMLIIFSTLILLAVGMGIYIVYKMTRGTLKQKFPHETAMEELIAIRDAFSGGGDVKGYYVGVSDRVRHYIEKVFNLKAPEMTTEEFLGSLKDSASLSAVHKNLLKGFLGACDMVKFAKYAPSRIEAESIFTTAKIFIEETKDVFAQRMEGAKH